MGRRPTFGSILGATVLECLFRVVIRALASDTASSIFSVFKNQLFSFYFILEYI